VVPIPDLDVNGLLPTGVHVVQLEEVRRRFGAAQSSSRRPDLFAKLLKYINDARLSGLVTALILDGSFVTSKEEPEDIDLIAVLRPEHDFAVDLRPLDYNVLSKKRCKRMYGFDVFAAVDGDEGLRSFVDFFKQVRGSELEKGLLRVELW
jgi:hypothetical protein